MADEQRYLAYLVRLWVVHDNGGVVWRASVEDAHMGERRAFANLAGLFDFLQAATEQEPTACGQLEGGRAARPGAG